MMRQFVHRRPDGSRSEPETLHELMNAAETRVRQGDGKFQLTQNRHPIGPLRVRKEALTSLERNLTTGKPGPVYRVTDPDGVDFSCREIDAEPSIDPRRREFVGYAEWGVQHAAQVHYSQSRPIPQYGVKHLPMTLDCSGFVIELARWANIPDPSGGNYSDGSTDSILAHLRHIDRRDLQIGDLVLWAIGLDGKHVAAVTGLGSDPMLASHGSDAGPLGIHLSAEDNWHGSEALHYLRLL
jgi:hypothetical protein